jgi:predicted nucleic acid-binding protein
MTYILDADWAINALAAHAAASSTLNRLAPRGIAIAWLTVCEIYEGAFRSANPSEYLRRYREFLHPFRRLPVTDPIAERFAELRAFLRRRGQLISDFDTMLAATALEHDFTVLTYNVDDFKRIADLRLYQPS